MSKRAHWLALLIGANTFVTAAAACAQDRPAAPSRSVFINGERLPEVHIQALEEGYRVRIADGRYWYDPVAGAWGVEGGPTVGLILPGLPLGGPLREDASNGTTAVWVNGRRLPLHDLLALQQLTGPIRRGRYWLDSDGNAGYEGGPSIVNLRRLATGGRSGGPWSHHTRSTDAHVGGDGNFFYYIDGDISVTGG